MIFRIFKEHWEYFENIFGIYVRFFDFLLSRDLIRQGVRHKIHYIMNIVNIQVFTFNISAAKWLFLSVSFMRIKIKNRKIYRWMWFFLTSLNKKIKKKLNKKFVFSGFLQIESFFGNLIISMTGTTKNPPLMFFTSKFVSINFISCLYSCFKYRTWL